MKTKTLFLTGFILFIASCGEISDTQLIEKYETSYKRFKDFNLVMNSKLYSKEQKEAIICKDFPMEYENNYLPTITELKKLIRRNMI